MASAATRICRRCQDRASITKRDGTNLENGADLGHNREHDREADRDSAASHNLVASINGDLDCGGDLGLDVDDNRGVHGGADLES